MRSYWFNESVTQRDKKYQMWRKSMPYIPMSDGWELNVLPPVGGAAVRFRVKRKGDSDDNWVSVYADFENALGFYCDDDGNEVPYWEVYPAAPDEDGYRDTERFAISDVDGLVSSIKRSLKAFDL